MRFDEVERNHGTQSPRSVCWSGDWVFYHSPIGFYSYNISSGERTPIGRNRVDEWVLNNVIDVSAMRGIVDPTSQTVAWSINRRTDSHYDAFLVYRWDIDAWGIVHVDHTLLGNFTSGGASLDSDEVDDFYGSTIDDAQYQLSLIHISEPTRPY